MPWNKESMLTFEQSDRTIGMPIQLWVQHQRKLFQPTHSSSQLNKCRSSTISLRDSIFEYIEGKTLSLSLDIGIAGLIV
jgi:hypothetical protein